MVTYLILNIIVMIVLLVALHLGGALTWNKSMTAVLGVLLVTTAIFDSLIVSRGIVAYDSQQILGITIGSAPLEDFFYAIAAVILVPNVWKRLEGKLHERKT